MRTNTIQIRSKSETERLQRRIEIFLNTFIGIMTTLILLMILLVTMEMFEIKFYNTETIDIYDVKNVVAAENNVTYELGKLDMNSKIESKEKEIVSSLDNIVQNNVNLIQCKLPSDYYENIDFSSFQPFMSYRKVTDVTSPSYKVCYNDNSYTDENGFRRYRVTFDQFSVDGQDDYVVALGTFYKEKGTAGSRFLIETTTGSYTVITGGEKADEDTDEMNMFSYHCDGTTAGIIEWIVDENKLHPDIKYAGTVTRGPVEAMHGDIIAIYRIE